ncbi:MULTISPECIES: homocitrate synthase/isopropylmalate synthase family protein [unclassified Microcoleus]|uniref:homocitrate synthase/isopropylmalate synthase family protein n=1 Tax=unclassified Microcoleus TaxID=2642155 RepID=UPI004040A4A1
MGKNAFTHYAGAHLTAMAKDERLYQSLNPEILVIKSSIALGMQSGLTAVELALKQIGREELAENKNLVAKILKKIKEIVKRGTPIDIDKQFIEIIDNC